jgi:predicted pyridoxine 5'-phosphate oxidase superfamily flavin-nucleotide-binding protein
MPKLSDEMKKLVERQRLGFVATVCPDGTPNLSPKGTVCVLDNDHLIFADIRSPGTVSNLRTNPHIEVNVVDHFLRKGYRFKGTAQVLEAGADFARHVHFFSDRGLLDAPDRIRAVVIVRVDQARPLISPGYDHVVDEASMRAYWLKHYLGEASA